MVSTLDGTTKFNLIAKLSLFFLTKENDLLKKRGVINTWEDFLFHCCGTQYQTFVLTQ